MSNEYICASQELEPEDCYNCLPGKATQDYCTKFFLLHRYVI